KEAVSAAEADALHREAAQVDRGIRRRVDRDAVGAARYQHAGFADTVVDDADGFRDRYGTVAARVEDGNLALVVGLVVRDLKTAARRGAVAVVGVVAIHRRHKGARQLRLRRRGLQAAREQERQRAQRHTL